jgi:aminopeptidase N
MRALHRLAVACTLCCGSALAAPHYTITARLAPASGMLDAAARIVLPAGETVALRMDDAHRIESMQLDGRPLSAARDGGQWRIELAAATRERQLELRWQIRAQAPDSAARHRDTLTAFAPQIGEAGSFLPAGGAWYPLPHDSAGPLLHRYALNVDLPATQRALAPGDLTQDTVRDGRRSQRFEARRDGEGADLMAGPWQQTTRALRARDGRTLTLVTLFHPELAAEAEGYLDAAAQALTQFETRFGDYPYSRFSIASSPTPTGFGMAGLTYLGIDVLRLPFIRHTSLPHEIAHNWWGNGVHLAPDSGNWSEGLTTFVADYAQREAQGDDAARTLRLDWLRGLSALAPAAHDSLADFGGRTHDASQAIGYHKAALVFLMLRDTLGSATFDRALRTFWSTHRHRRAGWDDLRLAFEQASGRDLRRFFAEWVEGRGLAEPRLDAVRPGADSVTLTLAQPAPPHLPGLPLHLRDPDSGALRIETLTVDRPQQSFTLPLKGCAELAIDPDFRTGRRLRPGEAPPILREATLDGTLALTVLDGGDARVGAAADALVGDWLDTPPPRLAADAAPGRTARMVIGRSADLDRWLARHGLPARPRDGDVVAWAVRSAAGGTLALVAARDADALTGARRALPHYGQQGWVVIDGGRASARGQWPAQTQWTRVCALSAR